MLKKILALSVAVAFLSGAAFAGAPDKSKGKKKPAPRLTQVMVCPITGEKPMGAGGGTEVVGKYMVHFCCPMCKPQFDKLSKKDKEKKIAEALKKQKAGSKTKS
jgi:hypothetical protein